MALFEGELIGQFKLPEDDHRALVITDGNDTYTIFKAKDSDPVYDAEFWGLLAKGKDGVTPAIGYNGNWFLGNQDTGQKAQGPTGSMANTVKLTDETDLNFTVDNGLYIKTDGKVDNGPEGVNVFTVLVYGDKDKALTQILHATSNNSLYIRSRFNGIWTTWRQITQWN